MHHSLARTAYHGYHPRVPTAQSSQSATFHPFPRLAITTNKDRFTLTRAVGPFLSRTLSDCPLIVVIDGAPAGPIDLSYDGPVLSLSSPRSGRITSRNFRILIKLNSLVAFLDHDNETLSDRLSTQVSALTNLPDAMLFYSSSNTVERTARSSQPRFVYYLDNTSLRRGLSSLNEPSTWMARHELILRYNIWFSYNICFHKLLSNREDLAFISRIVRPQPTIEFERLLAKQCLTNYTIHRQHMSANLFATYRAHQWILKTHLSYGKANPFEKLIASSRQGFRAQRTWYSFVSLRRTSRHNWRIHKPTLFLRSLNTVTHSIPTATMRDTCNSAKPPNATRPRV